MDFTTWWAFIVRHREKLLLAPVGILLFGAGWQLGRVTTPYNTAHPIIFEENSSQAQADAAALNALSAEDDQAAAIRDAPVSSPIVPPAQQQQGRGAIAGSQQGAFVGSVNSDLYHAPDCPSASRIKEENQIWFSSPEEAAAAGYKPSKCTQEKLPQ